MPYLLLDEFVEYWVWTYLHLCYAPYKMPSMFSDAEQWASQISLNGAKFTTLCKPN